MFRADAIPMKQSDDVWIPTWLGPEDHPWLAALLDELRRYEGRPMREWTARAAEPLRAPAPIRRLRLAVAALDRLCTREDLPEQPTAAQVREALTLGAQQARDQGRFRRDAVLAEVGAPLGLAPELLIERMFADIPSERRLRLPVPFPDAHELALRTNLAIAQGVVRGASKVEVSIGGASRALLRQILLKRLLCTVRPDGKDVTITVSGPFALFRHTTVYGGALASLIPVLRGADRFTVHAACVQRGRPLVVRLASGDPVFPPGEAPKRYDSKLEERFAREFAKLAPEWDLVREPEPVAVDNTWVFPDFALVDRRTAERRWLLEIVGYWTPEYLDTKLARLARSGRKDLILCVDTDLGLGDRPMPSHALVVPFQRRLDAAAVKRAIDGHMTMVI